MKLQSIQNYNCNYFNKIPAKREQNVAFKNNADVIQMMQSLEKRKRNGNALMAAGTMTAIIGIFTRTPVILYAGIAAFLIGIPTYAKPYYEEKHLKSLYASPEKLQ